MILFVLSFVVSLPFGHYAFEELSREGLSFINPNTYVTGTCLSYKKDGEYSFSGEFKYTYNGKTIKAHAEQFAVLAEHPVIGKSYDLLVDKYTHEIKAVYGAMMDGPNAEDQSWPLVLFAIEFVWAIFCVALLISLLIFHAINTKTRENKKVC